MSKVSNMMFSKYFVVTAVVREFFDLFNILVFVKIMNLALHVKQFYSLMKFSASEIRSLGFD